MAYRLIYAMVSEPRYRGTVVLKRASLVAIAGWAIVLLTSWTSSAQNSCQLSIQGSGTSSVFINASGCAGDTIAIIAGAEGNQKQFPAGNGPELFSPFNLTQCDLDLHADHSVDLHYTAVVISGPDKGKTSATYSGTLDPDRPPADSPPTVTLDGVPSAGNFVRPGDTIALSVTATDDYGVAEIKVMSPDGKVMLDNRPARVKNPGSKCHPQSVWQTVNLAVPKTYTVLSNPPVPTIRFSAVARDTGGHEATATAEYRTEATWTGMMLLVGSGSVPGNTCTTNWRIALTVNTSPKNEVSGHAEARHNPLQCNYAGPRDSNAVMSFAISGTFDGKQFRLYFNPTGGASIAWGIAGLHLLLLPTPLPVDLTLASGDRNYAKGSLGRDNSGNVEGKKATASLAGTLYLQCCFSDSGPAAPAKTPPIFLGEDNKQMYLGGDQ